MNKRQDASAATEGSHENLPDACSFIRCSLEFVGPHAETDSAAHTSEKA